MISLRVHLRRVNALRYGRVHVVPPRALKRQDSTNHREPPVTIGLIVGERARPMRAQHGQPERNYRCGVGGARRLCSRTRGQAGARSALRAFRRARTARHCAEASRCRAGPGTTRNGDSIYAGRRRAFVYQMRAIDSTSVARRPTLATLDRHFRYLNTATKIFSLTERSIDAQIFLS